MSLVYHKLYTKAIVSLPVEIKKVIVFIGFTLGNSKFSNDIMKILNSNTEHKVNVNNYVINENWVAELFLVLGFLFFSLSSFSKWRFISVSVAWGLMGVP